MPNRGIKESICTSKTLSALSAEAERLFYRILVNCDDYGRMESEPEIVISKCFPLSARSITLKQINKWLAELAQEMIVIYQNDDKQYLEFVKWEKHNKSRAANPKFPGPNDPESTILSGLLTHANTCKHMQADEITCPRTSTIQEQVQVPRPARADEKKKYADFVSLTNDEYTSLVAKLGSEEATNRCIEILDNYKGAKGKKYLSDYRAILNWVVVRFREEQQKVVPLSTRARAVGEGWPDLRD